MFLTIHRTNAGVTRMRLPYIFALIVALNMGILSPLVSVAHCILWSQSDTSLILSGFICQIAQGLPTLDVSAGGLATPAAPQFADELLGLPLAISILVILQATFLVLYSCASHRRLACAPLTPPPR
jgi:hypothetical protein